MSKAVDLYFSFRFLKLLTTKWKDTDAFSEGVIDSKGKLLIKVKDLETTAQKDSYSVFHRLVFNIKRLIERVPFGSSQIKSYAAALFLIREETGMDEENILSILSELGVDTDLYITEDSELFEVGDYILNEDIYGASKGTPITISDTTSVGFFSGIPIYKTTNNLYITSNNIK